MSANGRRRVVITGLGAVTPLGNDVETSWQNLVSGQSGAGPITQFDPTGYFVNFACELKDFEPTDWIDYKTARRMDRFAQMVVAAARQAEQDSGSTSPRSPTGSARRSRPVSAGSSRSRTATRSCASAAPTGSTRSRSRRSSRTSAPAGCRSSSGRAARCSAQCTACAASNMAIGEGADAIRLGRADVMFCGGTEAPVTEVGIAGFGAMRALSRRNDDPKRASRPFDMERDGFVMGEAGAVLVLEELERAKARGAKIYAELAGYGVSSDAQHITEPDPTGKNPARAMQMALGDAGIGPSEVDYVNAHGTSTPLGDAAETRVIKLALGEENARKTPISSTKGSTGHCLGGAGAVEAIFSTLAIQHGMLPPTINYEFPDPECDLDYIPNEARQADVKVAISNSFGFGGHNASIVLKRFED